MKQMEGWKLVIEETEEKVNSVLKTCMFAFGFLWVYFSCFECSFSRSISNPITNDYHYHNKSNDEF